MALLPLPPAQQQALGEAVAAMGDASFLVAHPALQPLREWLEADDNSNDGVVEQENWEYVVDPHLISERLDGMVEEPVSEDEKWDIIRDLVRQALDGDLDFWGEEHRANVGIDVETSTGRRLVIGCEFISFNVVPPIEWQGLFASRDAYRAWFRAQGYFITLDEYDALTRDERRARFFPPPKPRARRTKR